MSMRKELRFFIFAFPKLYSNFSFLKYAILKKFFQRWSYKPSGNVSRAVRETLNPKSDFTSSRTETHLFRLWVVNLQWNITFIQIKLFYKGARGGVTFEKEHSGDGLRRSTECPRREEPLFPCLSPSPRPPARQEVLWPSRRPSFWLKEGRREDESKEASGFNRDCAEKRVGTLETLQTGRG